MPISEHKAAVQARLERLFSGAEGLRGAMAYSVLAPGKRIRPILTMEFYRLCAGAEDGFGSAAVDAACAVELLHTYSLIHDDLPCMDNDELRRGRPTNHMVYGEWLALLAGDALQAEAFGVLLRSGLPDNRRARAAEILAWAAGADGICMGQYLDLDCEGKSITAEQIFEINSGKTAALLEAACMIGCVCAGDFERMDAAKAYGAALGTAFQVRDDILDVESSSQVLGKPVGSDERNEKATLVALLGIDRCTAVVTEQSQAAAELLRKHFPGSEKLQEFTLALADRKK